MRHTFPPSKHLQAQQKPVDSETLERQECFAKIGDRGNILKSVCVRHDSRLLLCPPSLQAPRADTSPSRSFLCSGSSETWSSLTDTSSSRGSSLTPQRVPPCFAFRTNVRKQLGAPSRVDLDARYHNTNQQNPRFFVWRHCTSSQHLRGPRLPKMATLYSLVSISGRGCS